MDISPGGWKAMPKFMIQRDIPGAGKLSPAELQAIAAKSNGVIHELNTRGMDVQWVQSFVSDDRITCVYNAPNEETIREHAMKGNFPANAVTRICTVIDPLTGEQTS